MTLRFSGAAITVAGCAVVAAVAAPSAVAAPPVLAPSVVAAASFVAAPAPTSFALLQQRAEAAIQLRLSDLHAAQAVIAQTASLTSTDRAALTAIINGDINGFGSTPGLTTLEATIEGATTRDTVVTAAATITVSYRVYALVLPQVHLTEASDVLTVTAVPLLDTAETDISTAIAAAQAAGKDVAEAQADLSDLQHQIAAIGTATAGLPAQIDAFTPTEWNSDTTLLRASRQQLGSALEAAKSAGHDVNKALADLQ